MSLDALLDATMKTEPWDHQLREFEISADLPARALLWQMRTGKTKLVIDTACSLYRRGKIESLIIFAPNGVHENWIVREMRTHLWLNVDVVSLAWQTRVAGLKGGNRLSVSQKAEWEAQHLKWWAEFKLIETSKALTVISFNSESMTRKDIRKAIAKLLKKRRCMIVWDESSDFRTPGSSRTLMSRAIARHAPYRRILDGTVVTNSPLHAYSQYELLEKAALGYDQFGDFKDRYAEYKIVRRPGAKPYPKLEGYRNLEELRERMSVYSSVVLRSDCEDLPALHATTRTIGLTDQQVRIYREIHKQTQIEVARGEVVSIGERTAKLMKLQQVVSGFLKDDKRVVHDIPGGNPRLEACSEEVFLAPGKVIIWCQFQEDLDRVAKRMRTDGWDVIEYHGRVSTADKAKGRERFRDETQKIVFVGQPQAGGRGLELIAPNMIWYSHTFNAIIRKQADERATKMGGGNVQVLDLVAPGVDEYILETVRRNVDVADEVAGNGMKWLQETQL